MFMYKNVTAQSIFSSKNITFFQNSRVGGGPDHHARLQVSACSDYDQCHPG